LRRALTYLFILIVAVTAIAFAAAARDARRKLDALAQRPIASCEGLIPSRQSTNPTTGTVDNGMVRHVIEGRIPRSRLRFKLWWTWNWLAVRSVSDRSERRQLFDHLSCGMRNYRST
jgi:hypothetical protein